MSQPEPELERRRTWAPCVALAALTLLTFERLLTDRFAFLNLDDTRYIVENPHVIGGLSRQAVAWAWTSFEQSNWHPLTWMSWQLDVTTYGLDPRGFHVTNLALHVANSIALFLALARATGGRGRSFAVAALFAIHPLHVESVAWISERKDVLSAFFSLCSLNAYVAYARRPGPLRYALSLVLFAVGLTAKAMLVTLPGVMLLMDVWPLGRLRLGSAASEEGRRSERPSRAPPRGIAWLLAEKVPLVALAAGASVLTVRAQSGMMHALAQLPMRVRVTNALVYCAQYIGRTFWPAHLVVFRPNMGDAFGAATIAGSGALVVAITVAAIGAWRSRPYLLFGWLWFLGTLVPVLGLVQVGFVSTTDHYTYVPLVGLFVMLVWLLDQELARRATLPRVVLALVLALVLAACALASHWQLRFWRDSVIAWQHVVDGTPRDAFARAFLARSLDEAGRYAEARDEAQRASELDPSWRAHRERGLALEADGDAGAARREYERSLLLFPYDSISLEHLAAECLRRGDVAQALRHYSTLAHVEPDDAAIETRLGVVHARLGHVAEAREHLSRALVLAPGDAEARSALAQLDRARGPAP